MTRTLEQKRAAYTLKFIQEMREDKAKTDDFPKIDQAFRTKLNTLVQKTPVQVLQNGLGQMLAYLLADNEGKSGRKMKPSGIFYDHLEEWLCGTSDEEHPCRVYIGSGTGLIEQLTSGNRQQYVRTQQETLALLSWLKKFSAAWLAEGGA